MRTSAWTVTVAIVAALAVSPTLAGPQQNAENPRPQRVRAAAADKKAPGSMLRPAALAKILELTPEQKVQADGIFERARAAAKEAETPQAKRRIHQAALDELSRTVLNDAQRQRLARIRQAEAKGPASQPAAGTRPMAILQQLDLTEEQQASARRIMAEAKAQAEQATEPQAKRQAHQAALRKIYSTVLTDSQRQKFDELRAAQGPAGKPDKPADRPHKQRRGKPAAGV